MRLRPELGWVAAIALLVGTVIVIPFALDAAGPEFGVDIYGPGQPETAPVGTDVVLQLEDEPEAWLLPGRD